MNIVHKEPTELKDLEKFLAGNGTISRRKIRASLGSRRSRKVGTKSVKTRKAHPSSRVRVAERFTSLSQKLAAIKKRQV